MPKKQLALLFLCGLVLMTVAQGLLPLLPIYAARLGASPGVTGVYLSLSYVALTIGSLLAGWLSDHLQTRKGLLLVSALLAIPALWLMGRATTVWQLTPLSATLWFVVGMVLVLLNIVAGLLAGPTERGRVFGVLGMAFPVALLVGGLALGPIADRWGYPALFSVCALFLVLLPLGVLFLRDRAAPVTSRAEAPRPDRGPGLGRAFYLLFAAGLIAMVGNFFSVFGRSLAMDALGFAATAVTSTAAVAGAVTLPIPLLAGWLSDRLGRRRLLVLAYLAGVVGLLLLARSTVLWHFWLCVSLMYVQNAVNNAVGSAFVTDLVPKRTLGQGGPVPVQHDGLDWGRGGFRPDRLCGAVAGHGGDLCRRGAAARRRRRTRNGHRAAPAGRLAQILRVSETQRAHEGTMFHGRASPPIEARRRRDAVLACHGAWRTATMRVSPNGSVTEPVLPEAGMQRGSEVTYTGQEKGCPG
jgi:MFS family permease